jgi:hypothetical protein
MPTTARGKAKICDFVLYLRAVAYVLPLGKIKLNA